MGKELKTIAFAAGVCLVCSLLLSAVYSGLRERQEINKANELKEKVLQAFGVPMRDAKGRHLMDPAEVSAMFAERIEGHVLDSQGRMTDTKVEDLTPELMNARDKTTNLKSFYPYYVFKGEDGHKRYAIHVSGMGLWSVVKGYLALEDDFATIAGMAFYEHAETPGLGGEIDRPAFQDQFPGKVLFENGQVQYFRVLKPSEALDKASVHGPSGATMTSKGITAFVNSDFKIYSMHFQELRDKGS